MDGKRGRDDLVPECPENKSTAWDEPPPSGHNPPRRGGGAGEQSYSDANRWRGKREPSPRRARPIEITVCADRGDARRRCMDMPVQLDRVGGFEKSPKSPQ